MTTIPEQRTQVLEAQRDEVEHPFIVRSAVHAAQLGVQTRALCGVWEFADLGGDGNSDWRLSRVQENDCPVCLAAA